MNSSGTRGKRRRSEKLERTKWRFNWKSRRTEQSSRSFPLYPLLYPLPVFSFALSPSLSLSLVYRRFLCLRVSPCTSSIHTISRLAWRSSASISCPPPPPRPPSSAPASLHSSLPSPRAPCSVLHKDQSIKNAALHEINPVAAPPPRAPSSFQFLPNVASPFLLLLPLFPLLPPPLLFLFLFSFDCCQQPSTPILRRNGGGGGGRGGGGGGGGMERHRRNYRGRDTIPLSRGWVPPRGNIVEPATTFVFHRARSRCPSPPPPPPSWKLLITRRCINSPLFGYTSLYGYARSSFPSARLRRGPTPLRRGD